MTSIHDLLTLGFAFPSMHSLTDFPLSRSTRKGGGGWKANYFKPKLHSIKFSISEVYSEA